MCLLAIKSYFKVDLQESGVFLLFGTTPPFSKWQGKGRCLSLSDVDYRSLFVANWTSLFNVILICLSRSMFQPTKKNPKKNSFLEFMHASQVD